MGAGWQRERRERRGSPVAARVGPPRGKGGRRGPIGVGLGWNEREGEGIDFSFFSIKFQSSFLKLNLNKFSLHNSTHRKNECCSIYASTYF